MKCIIHIGIHKTGSTSVQITLSHVRKRAESLGVLYPSQKNLGIDKFVCHHRLASEMNGFDISNIDTAYTGPSLTELIESVENTKPEYLILSSEVFSENSTTTNNLNNSGFLNFLKENSESITVVL